MLCARASAASNNPWLGSGKRAGIVNPQKFQGRFEVRGRSPRAKPFRRSFQNSRLATIIWALVLFRLITEASETATWHVCDYAGAYRLPPNSTPRRNSTSLVVGWGEMTPRNAAEIQWE